MRIKKRVLAAICAGAAACACLWGMHARRTAIPVRAAMEAAQTAMPAISAAPEFTLFPDLDSLRVTAVSVIAPDRSFQFQMDRRGEVSVNGQLADNEAFCTLVEQIAELPVEQHAAFAPETQELLLTLVVSTGTQQKIARFYGGAEQEKTRILLGSESTPEYRQTNGWRVGTLMMTCEGTRILDAHGNETPAQKIQ